MAEIETDVKFVSPSAVRRRELLKQNGLKQRQKELNDSMNGKVSATDHPGTIIVPKRLDLLDDASSTDGESVKSGRSGKSGKSGREDRRTSYPWTEKEKESSVRASMPSVLDRALMFESIGTSGRTRPCAFELDTCALEKDSFLNIEEETISTMSTSVTKPAGDSLYKPQGGSIETHVGAHAEDVSAGARTTVQYPTSSPFRSRTDMSASSALMTRTKSSGSSIQGVSKMSNGLESFGTKPRKPITIADKIRMFEKDKVEAPGHEGREQHKPSGVASTSNGATNAADCPVDGQNADEPMAREFDIKGEAELVLSSSSFSPSTGDCPLEDVPNPGDQSSSVHQVQGKSCEGESVTLSTEVSEGQRYDHGHFEDMTIPGDQSSPCHQVQDEICVSNVLDTEVNDGEKESHGVDTHDSGDKREEDLQISVDEVIAADENHDTHDSGDKREEDLQISADEVIAGDENPDTHDSGGKREEDLQISVDEVIAAGENPSNMRIEELATCVFQAEVVGGGLPEQAIVTSCAKTMRVSSTPTKQHLSPTSCFFSKGTSSAQKRTPRASPRLDVSPCAGTWRPHPIDLETGRSEAEQTNPNSSKGALEDGTTKLIDCPDDLHEDGNQTRDTPDNARYVSPLPTASEKGLEDEIPSVRSEGARRSSIALRDSLSPRPSSYAPTPKSSNSSRKGPVVKTNQEKVETLQEIHPYENSIHKTWLEKGQFHPIDESSDVITELQADSSWTVPLPPSCGESSEDGSASDNSSLDEDDTRTGAPPAMSNPDVLGGETEECTGKGKEQLRVENDITVECDTKVAALETISMPLFPTGAKGRDESLRKSAGELKPREHIYILSATPTDYKNAAEWKQQFRWDSFDLDTDQHRAAIQGAETATTAESDSSLKSSSPKRSDEGDNKTKILKWNSFEFSTGYISSVGSVDTKSLDSCVELPTRIAAACQENSGSPQNFFDLPHVDDLEDVVPSDELREVADRLISMSLEEGMDGQRGGPKLEDFVPSDELREVADRLISMSLEEGTDGQRDGPELVAVSFEENANGEMEGPKLVALSFEAQDANSEAKNTEGSEKSFDYTDVATISPKPSKQGSFSLDELMGPPQLTAEDGGYSTVSLSGKNRTKNRRKAPHYQIWRLHRTKTSRGGKQHQMASKEETEDKQGREEASGRSPAMLVASNKGKKRLSSKVLIFRRGGGGGGDSNGGGAGGGGGLDSSKHKFRSKIREKLTSALVADLKGSAQNYKEIDHDSSDELLIRAMCADEKSI